jgi:hypothetical protein
MMETVSTSETSVNFYQTTRRNILEDSNFHTRLRENMKSHEINKFHTQLLYRSVCKSVNLNIYWKTLGIFRPQNSNPFVMSFIMNGLININNNNNWMCPYRSMEKVPNISQLSPASFKILEWVYTFRCRLYPRTPWGGFSTTYFIILLIYSTTVASVSAEERTNIFTPTVSFLTLSPVPPHTAVCIN